ncbi:hypothetical protein AAMO2058_001142900 [Amorphochlora amoebiformis]
MAAGLLMAIVAVVPSASIPQRHRNRANLTQISLISVTAGDSPWGKKPDWWGDSAPEEMKLAEANPWPADPRRYPRIHSIAEAEMQTGNRLMRAAGVEGMEPLKSKLELVAPPLDFTNYANWVAAKR